MSDLDQMIARTRLEYDPNVADTLERLRVIERAATTTPTITDDMVERAARVISPNCYWDEMINGHLERRKENARNKARAALEAALNGDGRKCPRCNSPAPSLHPAVQSEGEVQICPDLFHAGATDKR